MPGRREDGEDRENCEDREDRLGDALSMLRAPGRPRPEIDAALAGGLRAWLEDGAAEAARPGARLLVDRRAVAAGAARPLPTRSGPARRWPGRWTPRALLQACVRSTFRLTVTRGPATSPFEDALAALSAGDDGPAVVDAVGSLGRAERAELRRDVAAHAARVAADWRPIPPGWLPRTADRATVPLAGGAVMLSVTADLVLGSPPVGCSSVCLLEVQACTPGPVHAQGRRLLALAETVRSGAAPVRVATYYSRSGLLAVEEVTDEMLGAAVDDVARVLESGAEWSGAVGSRAEDPAARFGTAPARRQARRAPVPGRHVVGSGAPVPVTAAPQDSGGRAA